MDGQLYKVVFPSGDTGVGNSAPEAVAKALGTKRHQSLVAAMPRAGYYWTEFTTRSLVANVVGKRGPTQNRNDMYEVAYVYEHPDRKNLKYTVFRSNKMTTLAQVPENSPAKVSTPAKLPKTKIRK
jgi:hypothetical protein